MLTQADKREDARIASHVPVTFSIFSSKFHQRYAAMTFNHSKGGMCFESNWELKPGTVVYIRMEDSGADKIYYGNQDHLRTSTLAQVKWCRELKDDFGTYYSVGVKYY